MLKLPETTRLDYPPMAVEVGWNHTELDDHIKSRRFFTADRQAVIVSLLVHTGLILGLSSIPVLVDINPIVDLLASVETPPEEITLLPEVAPSEQPSDDVGANSDARDHTSAISMAPVLADLSELPSPTEHEPVLDANVAINNTLAQAVGLVRSSNAIKGMTGVGQSGIDGAVDQITQEILRSMEERPTLVVWFFDQSGSLTRQRAEIRQRFERIYEELGIVQAGWDQQKKLSDQQLLTAIYAFGQQVHLLTPKPIAELDKICQHIDSIENDPSGVEMSFSAVYSALEKFKSYRSSRSGRGESRNVLFIVVTDERGDDAQGLEKTINECVKYAIPVYVLGVPAPFGRQTAYVKYVDPDPAFDQTPDWAEVDQGPESILPERVRLGFRDNFFEEPVIDSGFGPYALSRLAYETGGIFFTIHPNRRLGQRVSRGEISELASDIQYFFDPEIMAKYRPDYVSMEQYFKSVQKSPIRSCLVNLSGQSRADVLVNPDLRFVKRDDASLVSQLTQSQREAARVYSMLLPIAETLKQAEQFRDQEISPRWLASFDLSLGAVLAHKVRAEVYNAMLAKLKNGMEFKESKNNTWVLRPDDQVIVGSKLQKEAEQAVELLKQVASKHQGTPWGLLAERELQLPISWQWTESYTELDPPRTNNANVNLPPPPPRNDEANRLAPPPPKRPLPKL